MSTEPPVPPVPNARHVPDARQEPDARQSGPRDLEPTDDATSLPDPAESARSVLARARKSARDKGFRPGMKPAPNARRIGGMPPSRTSPDDRDPALLGTQLDRLLLDRGWTADVTVGSVMGRWAEIVGRDLAAHVRPVSFEGTVLTVQADSTAWATQVRLLTSSVLGRIEAEVGAGVVTDLVVLGPTAPSWVKGRRRVQGPGPRDTYG